jgi:sec-independent protein translocase protein TatB
MFGVDFSEIVLIFGLALVVLGPQRLPKVAATIGRWVGRARAMARQFREQLEQEANAIKEDVKPHLDEVVKPFAPEAPAPAAAPPVAETLPVAETPPAPPAQPPVATTPAPAITPTPELHGRGQ